MVFSRTALSEVFTMHTTIMDSKEFGETLRTRRKELKYTQQFLAEFTGFSVSYISDLENGKATAELGKALYLAGTLGLDCILKTR